MRLQIIERQRLLLREAITKLIGRGEPYALVDFPDYANVGDSAIWLGARKLLREVTGRDPDYTCSYTSYDADKMGSGIIFITGGGNFGDLYPAHQNFRLRLMTDFPGRSVIQLPQSIHFKDDSNTVATAEALIRHGNFTLMVRDDPSAAYAAKHFSCPVVIAPDCAFGLGPLKRGHPADYYIALLRTDGEATGTEYRPLLDLVEATIRDWGTEPKLPQLRHKGIRRALLRGAWSRVGAINAWRDMMAEYRLKRGVALVSMGEMCVTDRLHGHILSVLAGIPGVAFDNTTGKVSAYHNRWMPDLGDRVVVNSAEEALRAIPTLTR